MPLSKFKRQMLSDFAARHSGMSAWDWTWQASRLWDEGQANNIEIWEREKNHAKIELAFELHQKDDFSAAHRIWSELAEDGSVWSMHELGRCYEFGCGIAIDLTEAEKCYRQAAETGCQLAMLDAARLAASRNDYPACLELLEPGNRGDWAPAVFWHAWYRQEQSTSRATFRAIYPRMKYAAELGHPAARATLARFGISGRFGTLRIPVELLRFVAGMPKLIKFLEAPKTHSELRSRQPPGLAVP